MPPLSKSEQAIAKLVADWKRSKLSAKTAYDRADRILGELAKKLRLGEEVRISESGKHVVLLDNFANKDKVWGYGCVRRYDLEFLERP